MGRFASNFIKFKNSLRERGVHKTFIRALKKVSGILDCEEGVETLYYFLNHYVDITKLPPATGDLRKLQLCDAVLLSIFDAICEKQGWQYWLSWGTLLGAVRHKGFIPWDDDLDICMTREDYNKACNKLPEILASFGSDSLHCNTSAACIGLGYEHSKTGIWCDIFPTDKIYAESENDNALISRIYKYKKFYAKKGKNLSPAELDSARSQIINYTGGGYALHSVEFSIKPLICKFDIIFPLTKIEFEGYKLSSPCDSHQYLTKEYGDYMQFPKNGVEHHGGDTRPPLREWASRSGVNMDEVLEKLKAIEKFFRS
ncbi:MAG: LicD family protein [Synergistaceae bacterium]|nr:LicD family protein [Synergistaceae bacterium]